MEVSVWEELLHSRSAFHVDLTFTGELIHSEGETPIELAVESDFN
ncbi:hypothetical protein COLO4_36357 [Corchorus olitorius]|uniref:Uncharacterized protein n=1 Tax=Corchorus olitorius TaxID=93759 RepID=A0A1R3G9J3_9ROSI|nr:hypothetical protein COLO4_36357 [Corchorus olitorius]